MNGMLRRITAIIAVTALAEETGVLTAECNNVREFMQNAKTGMKWAASDDER